MDGCAGGRGAVWRVHDVCAGVVDGKPEPGYEQLDLYVSFPCC